MKNKYDRLELGQFIPVQYHYNMLNDTVRMRGFAAAIELVVKPGARVLELGGGTGVLSFFAAQRASHVWCVERNPELVAASRRIMRQNVGGEKVDIIQADAGQYLPPEPVDVVICEMLHVGLLREKQVEIIDQFKNRYLEKFGGPLPIFIPEACIQAFQLVEQDFHYFDYYAPTILFQNPGSEQDRSYGLSDPIVYHSFAYDETIPTQCCWDGAVRVTETGRLNAIRIITKNILAIQNAEPPTIDWHNQYLVVPLPEPIEVGAGDYLRVQFDYEPGASIDALCETLQVGSTQVNDVAIAR